MRFLNFCGSNSRRKSRDCRSEMDWNGECVSHIAICSIGWDIKSLLSWPQDTDEELVVPPQRWKKGDDCIDRSGARGYVRDKEGLRSGDSTYEES